MLGCRKCIHKENFLRPIKICFQTASGCRDLHVGDGGCVCSSAHVPDYFAKAHCRIGSTRRPRLMSIARPRACGELYTAKYQA